MAECILINGLLISIPIFMIAAYYFGKAAGIREARDMINANHIPNLEDKH